MRSRTLMRLSVTVSLLPASFAAAPASSGDRVIGLLSLPEVFGREACDRFTPEDVTLYAEPDGRRTGVIRVDQNWTFAPEGGCDGLEVRVHPDDGPAPRALPTKEFEYEAQAVVVLDRRGTWFRIRLDEGAAWLRASSRDEFFPIDALLKDRLTYLTSEWDRTLSAAPGRPARRIAAPATGSEGPDVRTRQFRRMGDDLWVEVEILSESPCVSAGEPRVLARGWLRAHAASGEPAVWFYSRGC